MNIPGSPPLTAADFWALVKVFGSNEHKEYAARIEAAQAQLIEGAKAQAAEAKRLADLAAEVETQRQTIGDAETKLLTAQLDHANNVAAFKKQTDETLGNLALDRHALSTRATVLDQLQDKLKRQEEAIIEADRLAQERAGQREAALDQREAEIATVEATLNERKAKFLAAKEALGD